MKNKRGETLAFLTLDDRSGRIEVSVFGEDYERYKQQLQKDALLIIEGEVREDSFTGGLAMRCKDITPITEARSKFAKALEIQFREQDFQPELLQQLTACLQKHLLQDEGLPLQLVYTCSQGRALLKAADHWRVVPHDQLLEELRQLLGRKQVELIYRNEGETTAASQKITA